MLEPALSSNIILCFDCPEWELGSLFLRHSMEKRSKKFLNLIFFFFGKFLALIFVVLYLTFKKREK